MHPILVRARMRLVVGLLVLAALVPVGLAAARYPNYWEWIAPELTPMTWAQTVLLVLAAAAATLVAVIGRLLGWSRWERLPYVALALGFLYLAVDDRFALHERLRDGYLAPHDIRLPLLTWLAPGDFQMLLVAFAGLLVLPFVLRALRHDRPALVLFGLGVVAAAVSIGMDSIDPATMPIEVERLEQTAEECVELLAGSLFLGSLGTRLLGLLDALSLPASPTTTSVPSTVGSTDAPTVLIPVSPQPDPALAGSGASRD